jgi:predicted transcriptional regulator
MNTKTMQISANEYRTTTLNLKTETYNKVEELALKEDRAIAWVIRTLVEEALQARTKT